MMHSLKKITKLFITKLGWYLYSLSVLCGIVCISSTVHARLPIQTRVLTARITDAYGRIATRSFYVDIYKNKTTNRSKMFKKPNNNNIGAKPLAVILHGRAATEKARATMRTNQFDNAISYLLNLGYIVAVPTRIGYGKSTGADLEAAGTCYKRDYARGLQAAATQTLAVLNTIRLDVDVAPTGTVLIGNSYGGIVALATAARQPAGIRTVINISGGAGGNPYKHPKNPCGVRNLQKQLHSYGKHSHRIPTVWIYAANDKYWGAKIPRQWLQTYRYAGGVAHFYNVERLGVDGHTVFTHFPQVWQSKATKWLRLP